MYSAPNNDYTCRAFLFCFEEHEYKPNLSSVYIDICLHWHNVRTTLANHHHAISQCPNCDKTGCCPLRPIDIGELKVYTALTVVGGKTVPYANRLYSRVPVPTDIQQSLQLFIINFGPRNTKELTVLLTTAQRKVKSGGLPE